MEGESQKNGTREDESMYKFEGDYIGVPELRGDRPH